ncbi:MAG: PQQ-binding-like beta-propeller repeat protein [Planctomycetaceae bacterium]|nr:PQQ-binding-like beta-propeller repeat protein [Planctomycetaceae bacterium]
MRTTRRQILRLLWASLAAVAATNRGSRFLLAAVEDSEVARDVSWPSFRATPDQRGVSRSTLAEQPELKWEFVSKDGWVAGSAIVGSCVYAPALAGYLHCLDLKTGEEVWKYRSIEDPDPGKFAPGFKAAPLVTADTIYIGDEDGVLHAIDRTNGQRRWIFTSDAEIAGCVAEFEDKLLLASHDSFLYCLNQDGSEVWKFQTNDRINCSPAIAGAFTFLAGCDEHLRVIDLQTGKEFRDMPLESFLIASPAVVGDLLYVGTHVGEIVCVDWRKGEFVWRYEPARKMPFHASPAVTDDLVIVGGHDKNVHAVDCATGQSKWTFPTRARIECSAAVVDRRVFVGSGDKNLYGIDLETGKEVWKYNAGRPINGGIAIGEGFLICGEDQQNGRLLCFG